MGSIRLRSELPGGVPDALRASLDLDVELTAESRWHLRTVRRGDVFRTSGVIGERELVRWSVRLAGVLPVSHTSVITSVVPDDGNGGATFVDEMVSGLFTAYRHAHAFRPSRDGTTTTMDDDVSWTTPLGPIGVLADRLFVRRLLLRLLRDRNEEIRRRLLAGPDEIGKHRPTRSP
jgi:ligand-binding SRPBCC domain-containing protein